jgi:hypothetical protein
MPVQMKPIRRIVTTEDADGRSRVVWDSAAPNVNVGKVAASAGMTDVWVFEECPAPVRGERDDGDLPFSFDPPEQGGHLRLVHSAAKPAGYEAASDTTAVPLHAPRPRPNSHTWDRGGQDAYSSPVHRSTTIDVGVLVEGKRTLLLDDGAYPLEPGDCVVQLHNWHGWTNPDAASIMAFIMMGGREVQDGHDDC